MNNNIAQIKIPSSDSLNLSRRIVNPNRDWKILMILFSALIVGSLGFDFYLYQKIVSGGMYVDVNRTELTIENLKTDDLQKTLDNFETKKSNMAAMKLENLVDPSL